MMKSTPSRFSLSPSQQFPKNAFVALSTLQRRVGLQEIRPDAREIPIRNRPASMRCLWAASPNG